MASMKKGVSKDDLKRMMKKMKSEGTIKHPLAKYNSLGHLICTVCNCQVKSDKLWNPHLLSRSHKDNVALPQPEPGASKRVHSDAIQSANAKRHKPEREGVAAISTSSNGKPKSILKNAPGKLIAGYGSSEDDSVEEETGDNATQSASASQNQSAAQALPADFFDTTAAEPEKDGEEPMDFKPTESLPEGFFDDPKADAKARNIEYVDKDQVEWEKFQAELKDQVQISEQLQADEEEVITEDRHIEEIDEQL